MGWVMLGALALATFAVLAWLLRRRGVLELVGAALLIGVAGYAWQGSPYLAGSPTKPRANEAPAPSGFADERRLWLPQVGADARLLDSAEAMARSMGPDYSVGLLHDAVRRQPKDAILWMGLGNALAAYADGVVTPAARFAYVKAAALAPQSPAPVYFLALAYAESGNIDAAEKMWRAQLGGPPLAAAWRMAIGQKLALVAQVRALR